MARLLSIEDDPDLQHLLGLTLHGHGYDIHYAFNGREGYEKILSLVPDLVLLDLMLPLLNGVEVLKLMRENPAARETPVIVMMACFDQLEFVESSVKALGVVEYLRKPVQLEELVRLIKRVLTARGDVNGAAAGAPVRKGVVRLDPRSRAVWIDDRLLATLAPKRFAVLHALAGNRGGVTRSRLLRDIWGARADENVLEKTVQRLREDLGPEAARLIQTTGDGYELIG